MADTRKEPSLGKTKLLLYRAMMDLIEMKSFEKITVNDICQQSMVSRSTFYLHFEDKYQLMRYCLDIERMRLEKEISEKPPRDVLHSILVTIREQNKTYRSIYVSSTNAELSQMLQDFFHDLFSDMLIAFEEHGAELAGPIPLLAAYYSHGFTGMIIWWISKGFPISTEEMELTQYNLLTDIMND